MKDLSCPASDISLDNENRGVRVIEVKCRSMVVRIVQRVRSRSPVCYRVDPECPEEFICLDFYKDEYIPKRPSVASPVYDHKIIHVIPSKIGSMRSK